MNSITRRVALPLAVLSILLFLFYGPQRIHNLGALQHERLDKDTLLRILPIGDSITEGYASSDKNGWRLVLRQKLISAGYRVEFLGSQVNGENNTDNHHEGFGAYSISQILARLQADEIARFNPNLILIHAGTNDVDRSPPEEPYETAPDRLATLIDFAASQCPSAAILVATIIQDDHAGVQPRVDAFNAAIPGIVASRQHRLHIDVVQQKHIGGKDLVDLIHPTDAGYMKMAQNWFDKIKKLPSSWISSRQSDGMVAESA